MDPIWIILAFGMGWAVRQARLPPLLGFLAAGFVLGAFGVKGGAVLAEAADLGVWLLLFAIGLKLKLGQLKRPEVLVVATVHLGFMVVLGAGVLLGLGALGVPFLAELDSRTALLLAFALAFSSTVLAVKALEERGEVGALHGRVAIGILIIQDIAAVLFLTVTKGAFPSAWALLFIGVLLLGRPVFYKLLDRAGHGELVILLGLSLAVGAGATGFQAVGVKAELGALFMGVLMSRHRRAEELGRSLFNLKELFLVGFFLQIGMSGTPTLALAGLGVALALVAPIKALVFFLFLTRLKLRARTSLLASLSLGSTSEFGLLVTAVAARAGWLPVEWIVVTIVCVAATFVVASPINSAAPSLYRRLRRHLRFFETKERLAEERPVDVSDADILVCGMGMVGIGAYDAMRDRYGQRVKGIDFDAETVAKQVAQGRDVVVGDATDLDFWERVDVSNVSLIMLSIPNHTENLVAVKRLTSLSFRGVLAGTAFYDDELEELRAAGVKAAFNFFSEAGKGFAEHVCTTAQTELSCRLRD
jgi:predicted Kef-type K+ transport protein